MPDSIKLEYQNLKAQTKGPLWQFSGLILLFVLIFGIKTIGKSNSEKYEKEKQEYITSPKRGDIYEVIIKSKNYSTLKLVNVSKDSIFFSRNKFESNSIIGLYKIDKIDNYSDKVYSISKDKLKKMYSKGLITGVKRR